MSEEKACDGCGGLLYTPILSNRYGQFCNHECALLEAMVNAINYQAENSQLRADKADMNKLLDKVYDDICSNLNGAVKITTARLLMNREAVKHAAKLAKLSEGKQ